MNIMLEVSAMKKGLVVSSSKIFSAVELIIKALFFESL